MRRAAIEQCSRGMDSAPEGNLSRVSRLSSNQGILGDQESSSPLNVEKLTLMGTSWNDGLELLRGSADCQPGSRFCQDLLCRSRSSRETGPSELAIPSS